MLFVLSFLSLSLSHRRFAMQKTQAFPHLISIL